MIDAALLWVLVGGFLEPLWVIGLKKYNDTHNLAWGAFAVVLMIVSPGCLTFAMQGMSVGVAYAIWTGIGAVMAVNLGLSQGWKRAIPGCLGIAIGIAFLFVIALSGTGAVLATHPAAFSVIQLIGAAFLAYLGIRSILKKPKHASLIGRHDEQTESGFSQFMKCAAISAANPQPIIFGLTVLPSFIDPTFSYVFQSAVMIVIYALIVFVMMMAYAILAAHARVFLSGPRGPRVINCISGVVFLFLAAFLLYRALAL